MSIKGPSTHRRSKAEELKRMGALINMAQGTLKVRAKRRKETAPRNQPERQLRADVIRALRKDGCRVYRIENAMWGKRNSGIADLLVFHPGRGKYAFIELKAARGRLSEVQRVFQGYCQACGVRYVVVRSVGEALSALC